MGGGLAGPTGLVIILLLVLGTVLLIRNMNARLRRLRYGETGHETLYVVRELSS